MPLSELVSRDGVSVVWKGLMVCTPSALRTEPSSCGEWSTSKAQGSTVQVRSPQGAHRDALSIRPFLKSPAIPSTETQGALRSRAALLAATLGAPGDRL